MAISPEFTNAVMALQALSPAEAARIVSSDIDLRNFLNDHRFELTETEIMELKSNFRG
jgi:hypothetical protein